MRLDDRVEHRVVVALHENGFGVLAFCYAPQPFYRIARVAEFAEGVVYVAVEYDARGLEVVKNVSQAVLQSL
ncbi:MAG: hypothetical protein SXQ77_05590, partial [Halobacteria archaeon]|nr:hypothetical protein [Halobacteria archaeon]